MNEKKPKLQWIPLNQLDAHPDNSNEMNDRYFQKLKENIGRTNRYPALIVRPKGERFELLDGFYRHLVLKDLGFVEAKCEVWDVNDREARLLLVTLNRLRGTDGTEKRAKLLAELKEDFGDVNFSNLIPETERAFDGLLNILKGNELKVEDERGLLEEKLTQSGVDLDMAEKMASLYKPPDGKPYMKFVFDNEEEYNKAIKFFGKPDVRKLIELINFYVKNAQSKA